MKGSGCKFTKANLGNDYFVKKRLGSILVKTLMEMRKNDLLFQLLLEIKFGDNILIIKSGEIVMCVIKEFIIILKMAGIVPIIYRMLYVERMKYII